MDVSGENQYLQNRIFAEQNSFYHPCVPQWGPNAMGTLPGLLFFLGCTRMYSSIRLTPKRPHIVLMVADDLGWNDVSFHGSKQIPTPNVDAIARDGIILNQYYVQPICSPSRATLMTGKYPIRTGFQHNVILKDSPWGLSLTENILPEYLKALKYSTHAVGKWHLGFFKKEYLPTERGFDSFFGYYSGLEDYFTHVSKRGDMEGLDLHDNEKNVWHYNGTYGPDLFTAKARKVILEHNPDESLFLYFAQQSPHSGNFNDKPLQAPKKYVEPMVGIEDKKRKLFAGMVSSMDHSVGEIFEALEMSGMLDDAIFIFTTDNGGASQDADGTSGSNWPLKGGKYTLWEGGIRGVSFIWSSFLRQTSRVQNELMHISDWLPTILSAVGGHEALKMLPENIDGINQWPSVLYGFPSPRRKILLNLDSKENVAGIRIGRFKLVKGSFKDGKFDKWYDKEGRNYSTTYSPRTQLKERLYRQNYMRFLQRSKAARLLWYKYNKDPCLVSSCQSHACKDLEVKCAVPPPSAPTCNDKEEPCLYDIISDPCEYYNIAAQFPELTADMENAIEKYRAVSIPPKDLPRDPKANPKFHGNAWVPWK